MKLLALDTSSTACSIALLNQGEITSRHIVAPMQQAKLVLNLIDEILQASAVDITELDAIVFGQGPGSFTGVRIATSIAQGLGFAASRPLIPISSLAAVAQTAYHELGWKNILAAVDARIQEVYWAAYQVQENGLVELVGKEFITPPDQITIECPTLWQGAGSAWEVYRERILVQPENIHGGCEPTAVALLKLATPKFNQQDWITAAEAKPVYLRDQVALTSRQRLESK